MFRISFWEKFLDGMPEYLARHYWWAYLWRPAIWFFDHQPIINLILFGQYKRLLTQTLQCLENRPEGRFLQLTCVYGKLTPSLLSLDNQPLYLIDVARVQLDSSLNKLKPEQYSQLLPARMNAESLAFKKDSFSTILIFFLMHEMPASARKRTLSESIRILQTGGRLIIVEYAENPHKHWIYRLKYLRKQLLHWEPFLEDFWKEDINAIIEQEAINLGKILRQSEQHLVYDGFYRVMVYEITE